MQSWWCVWRRVTKGEKAGERRQVAGRGQWDFIFSVAQRVLQRTMAWSDLVYLRILAGPE